MHSIAFYNRSDQRKGKMKPPPNPFTQVQNIFTNTHNYRIFSQTHTDAKYFNKHTGAGYFHKKQKIRSQHLKIYTRLIKQIMNAMRIPPLAKVF